MNTKELIENLPYQYTWMIDKITDVCIDIKNNGNKNIIYKSENYSLGGTIGDYMGGIHQMSPSEIPSSFVEFDCVFLLSSPDISFLKYNELKNKYVKTTEEDECDYYGGCSTNMFFSFNLTELIKELIEENLFDIDKTMILFKDIIQETKKKKRRRRR